MSELQPGEMGAIYLLKLGKEMPETVTKINLIKKIAQTLKNGVLIMGVTPLG